MRGTVMAIKNGEAVLLTRGGGFVKVKDRGYSIGDKVKVNTVPTGAARLCAMAASFLILCGIGSYVAPAGYVSVDINPSLIMTVNVYDRVISARALNSDAEILLSNVEITGKSAKETMEILIDESTRIGYLNENNTDVLVEIVSNIGSITLDGADYSSADVVVGYAEKSDLKTANEMNVSIAKAKAIVEYTNKNGGTISENAAMFEDKSVKEILREQSEENASAKTAEAAGESATFEAADVFTASDFSANNEPIDAAQDAPAAVKIDEIDRSADEPSEASDVLTEKGRAVPNVIPGSSERESSSEKISEISETLPDELETAQDELETVQDEPLSGIIHSGDNAAEETEAISEETDNTSANTEIHSSTHNRNDSVSDTVETGNDASASTSGETDVGTTDVSDTSAPASGNTDGETDSSVNNTSAPASDNTSGETGGSINNTSAPARDNTSGEAGGAGRTASTPANGSASGEAGGAGNSPSNAGGTSVNSVESGSSKNEGASGGANTKNESGGENTSNNAGGAAENKANQKD